MFQHTAARRRLGIGREESRRASACFNTQPPEGGWIFGIIFYSWTMRFQHTAARRRLDACSLTLIHTGRVSTHSRPKAAGTAPVLRAGQWTCFNTQPPEGGWSAVLVVSHADFKFQHTAARRRLALEMVKMNR